MECSVCYSLLIGIASVILFIYFYIQNRFSYFKKRNILHEEPTFLLGNMKDMGRTKHSSVLIKDLYDQFVRKDVLAGMYFFLRPTFIILDPELTKNILVRDFHYFHDRGIYYNERDDPLSMHLFALEGTKWKNLRAKLTPTFTSGKMKLMFETVLKCSEELENYLKPLAEKSETVDFKDLLSRFTTDVIGSCAFGINCNSIQDPESQFRAIGKKVFNPSLLRIATIMFCSAYPKIARKLQLTINDRECSEFFLKTVKENLKYRKENNIERNDFFQNLLKMENNNEIDMVDGLTFQEIAAQCFLFFVAGFETSSSTISFCVYELSKNQVIQDKVRNEINVVLEKRNGVITYESLLELHYMDKVINETLRMYPPVDSLIRTATKDYTVPNSDHIIEKRTMVFVPIYGIHMDPSIYPEPEKYCPERFDEENKEKRHPFSYLPFGEGPHNCIGSRFGMMQTRLGLIYILKNYKIKMSAKTAATVDFVLTSAVITQKGGNWLTIETVK